MSDFSCIQNPIRRRSPLTEGFEAMGVTLGVDHGWDTVLYFTSPEEETQTVLQSVGVADVSQESKFDFRGRDLDTSLALSGGAQIWPQRRGQFLVTCAPEFHKVVRGQLDGYATVNDSSPIYVSDVTPVYVALLLSGPQSSAVLGKLVDIDLSDEALPNLACTQTGIHHVHVLVARQDLSSVRAYLIIMGREYGEWLWKTVLHTGYEFGIQAFGAKAYQTLRAL